MQFHRRTRVSVRSCVRLDRQESRQIEGVSVKIYNPAKTVVDCFKYRNKIGLDVTQEALRDYRRKYRGGMDELWRYAKICRVERVMRPYLEALG